jgi:uncharacterized protein YkwD
VITLNLFDDVYLTAVRDHAEINTSEGFAWIGTIEGMADSHITLVVENEKLSGTITLPDLIYQIRPIEGAIHSIREIDRLALPAQGSAKAAAAFNGQEQAVFDLVNQERAIQGKPLLRSDSRLTAAARAHSQDMAEQNYFSHTGANGSSPGQRIQAQGYAWNAWGENIAYGYATPEAVMNAWMNSPGHRANILNTLFCDIGVGYFQGGANNRPYWTQDFARQQGVSTCPSSGNPSPGNPNPGNPNPPSEIIIDNRAANTAKTGTWTVSSGANPWAGQSLYSNRNGTFRWLTQLSAAGSYKVYAWWTYHANRSTQVPHRIRHADGTATVVVNQKDPAQAGRWVLLGTYRFTGSGSEYVEVSSENGQACADAVRLVAQN